MTPLGLFGLGTTELLIILAVILVLFGGSRLAGLGKSSGKAIREFKEETRAIRDDEARAKERQGTAGGATAVDSHTTPSTSDAVKDEVHDAQIVDPNDPRRNV